MKVKKIPVRSGQKLPAAGNPKYDTVRISDTAFYYRNDTLLSNKGISIHGWLIFGLPPSEIAIHPSAENGVHEFYLLCDDIQAFVAELQE